MFQKNLIDLVEIAPGQFGVMEPTCKAWLGRAPDLIIALCLLGNVYALSAWLLS